MKHLFLLIAACIATVAQAQDVIVKRDGSTIISKVLEVNQADIKYKKFSNQQGPTYTINKSEVMAINYESGDKDTFEETSPLPAKQEEDDKPQIIEAQPAADNAEIISRYNQTYEHGEGIKDKDKQAKEGICILGVGENSVLSTEDVEIQFRQEPYEYGLTTMGGKPCYNILWRFFVQVHNKTNNIIYVDLGNTFRVMKNGESKSYYDTSEITINKGTGSGASVNLGAIAGASGIGGAVDTLANGMNVGSGKMSSTSKTYAKQRILAIPPKGSMPIEKYRRVMVKNGGALGSDKFTLVSEGEELIYGFADQEMPKIMQGEKYIYKEEESPYHAIYTITYSKYSDFKNACILKASVYMRELIGASLPRPYWNWSWWRVVTNKRGLPIACKYYIPNYYDYTIIGTFGYSRKAGNRNREEYLE